MLTLKTQEREGKTSARAYRKQGFVPGVYYGPKEKPVAVVFAKGEFEKVWRAAGESTVVSLETPRGNLEALIHDVAFDPVSNDIIHADLYIPESGKTVEVEVPIEFVGTSAAVKDLGGTLIKVLHELEIEALPRDLPHEIKVDISALSALDSQILAGDIALPAGVTLVTDSEEVVAAIAEQAKEEEEAAPVQDISQIEVEKKGKKEEEKESQD